jgi:hypothetical protein
MSHGHLRNLYAYQVVSWRTNFLCGLSKKIFFFCQDKSMDGTPFVFFLQRTQKLLILRDTLHVHIASGYVHMTYVSDLFTF